MENITLTPYLHFQGNCEKALTAYAQILDGSVQFVQRYDNPAMQAPEAYKNKVLHAEFTFSGNKIYASDVFPGTVGGPAGNNIAISLSLPNPEKANAIFNQLAEVGKVAIPFEKQFWGAWHGNLTDKFGVYWMLNCE